MALPQTSSNVIAGWVAIRYRLRGPNLSVCNGATSGLDAVAWARNLIIAGRAEAAVVVGVEPAGDVVTRVLGQQSTDAAVAVVLEPADAAASRGARPRATITGYARARNLAAALVGAGATEEGPVGLWLADEAEAAGTGASHLLAARRRIDLESQLGPLSGALGVLQCAAAAAYLEGGTRQRSGHGRRPPPRRDGRPAADPAAGPSPIHAGTRTTPMITTSVTIEELRTLIAGVLETEPEEVTDDAHFAHELDIDSLLMLEISTRVESAFGVPENAVAASGATTLAELHAFLTSQLTPEPPTSPLIRPRPVSDPAVRLFLLHHAGGSHLLYRGWAEHFPEDWELCFLEAPGRGTLQALPLIDDCDRLVDYFHAAIAPLLDRPFGFFGHSMGALIAYQLTRRLLRQGEPLPTWLGVSAYGAPRGDADSSPHLMADDELRAWLRSGDGSPPQLLDNDDVWRKFAPAFRSDFKLVDTWTPPRSPEPLPVPLTAFTGLHDNMIDENRLVAWRRLTTDFRGLERYDGGHFYLMDHQQRIAAAIMAAMRSAAP
ncbi:thioesterase domain-containing protein [Streptomyces sp. NPDC058249]|uniref:thioesterase domain-containing protein n=1 Tax=Streptomyces sp. NPDC058249 TaxID=3346403 RepID=UPI0036EB90A9